LEKSVIEAPSFVAVDLTPVLPGGENGGAKIFVLELLLQLSELMPKTKFLLLTHLSSHDELAAMDRDNIRRVVVSGQSARDSMRTSLVLKATRLTRLLPARVRRVAIRLGYGLNSALKRGVKTTFLRDLQVDLLFCPFTAPTYFEAGIPTVCTIYDLQYKTYPEFFSPEDVAHRHRTFEEACRRANALTAISEYSRVSAIQHSDIDPARIRTIHLRMAQRVTHGVGDVHLVLDRLDLTPLQYLIYPANFWKHKNHEMLLTAFGMACHQGLDRNIKLVCTGAGGERQEWLRAASNAMGIGERVVFPGFIPNDDLAILLSNAHAMIFPSLYEGFGLPIIEAMASGIPVACSNVASLPEIAGDAAVLFDPRIPSQIERAIHRIVTQPELRLQLIASGKARAAEFSDSKRMAVEYRDLFISARSNSMNTDSISGVHSDGWAGRILSIQVASATDDQSIEVALLAPDWLPTSEVSVLVTLNGVKQNVACKISAGTVKTLSIPIPRPGASCELLISPSFVPGRIGKGDDLRELSLMISQCVLKRADNRSISLFPAKTTGL
jgi:glycosyltransferase involved in cell wall biosynthesis